MKPTQLVFVILLFLSAGITGVLGAGTLLDPPAVMTSFGVDGALPSGGVLLVAVLGSALLSLSCFVFLAAWWSRKGLRQGRTLGMVAGFTLLLVAACAYGIAGSVQVLVLDGVRGLLLLGLGWLWQPEAE